LKVSEVARLTGVTVRTLHYYDEIGLLKPGHVTESGYRLYTNADLVKLQQILFFRELGFPLRDIRQILLNPAFDKEKALQNHRQLLLEKRKHIDGLLSLVDKTLEGDYDMSFKQFDTTKINKIKNEYAAEAKQHWGNTEAFAEYEEKTNSYDDPQWKLLKGEGAGILRQFGENRHLDPACPEAQELVKQWQEYITSNFYHCTKVILSCLGQMYIGDDRFMQNIDRYGQGTARFMAAAIEIYCQK